ncbi:MAG: DNA-3-methyladenine glycosylase I [Proteobacteria bacterium]|nr:DNA-3-methyladenine glycosylase I [Pseudomonadota bacterium]
MRRCEWAKTEPSLSYHDTEWGVPLHDDRRLFEFLVLEGTQAGLSWDIILKKRNNYRVAFDRFDPRLVSQYDEHKTGELIANPGIIRNRLKITAAIQNAKAFLTIQKDFGSFDAYLWRFVGGRPKKNRWRTIQQIPCRSAESDALSKDLSQRGFKFVGSIICYSFMQAVGLVNDHTVDCFRYSEIVSLSEGRRDM